ncbi:MAG: glycosyltransferase [Bacteroidales bacterium]|nr:glycosyltransferase [Bacteroidales bacterium]
MRRLLQINTNIGWNSVGRIAGQIGDAAIAAGWESYIAYSRDPGGVAGGSTSQLIRIGSRPDRYAHGLLTRLTDAHGLGSAAATRRLISRIDELSPDVVHLHNIHGYYINYPILFDYLSRSGIPVVWTLHDCWPLTGHCAFPAATGCDRHQCVCRDCSQTRSYPASWLRSRASANQHRKAETFGSVANLTIVPVSHWLNSIVSGSFLGDKPRLVIHNGIDVDIFNRTDAVPTRSVLAAASVWDERKGLGDLVGLRALLPDDVGVCVLGLSRSQCKRMPAGITALPRCDDTARLATYYSEAGVFINLSSADNLPSVNLEAQACGTPVVCYDSGGMPETVSHETGLVVPRGDIGAMAHAVMRVLDSRRQKYHAAECRNHILAHFDAAHAFDKYIGLYNKLSE